jgi:dihydroorotase
MALLLKNARLIDPSIELDQVADMVIRDGRIVEIGQGLSIPKGVENDLTGKIVVPGLVDPHVHLREPGYEYKEDIASGGAAAARGGFTAICAMPNTAPVCDDGSRVAYVRDKAAAVTHTRVWPAGAITKGSAGQTVAEIGDMVAAGAVAFTDDGQGVQDGGVMRTAMDYIKMFDKTVLSHCQMEDLAGGGMVNEGVASTRLGLAGWPAVAEETQIARDIALCALTGCALHIQHVTTARGVEQVAQAKAAGLPVTAEVTPHHLFLTEDVIDDRYPTAYKVNPPLRTAADTEALIEALVDGTIDCVATDHAPHAAHEKALEFELAPFGMIGLETALGLVLTELVGTGRMSWARLVDVMAHAPRRILGLPPVQLISGATADLTVIDPTVCWTVEADGFVSRSNNSGFIGRTLVGRATDVYVGGYASLENGKVVR